MIDNLLNLGPVNGPLLLFGGPYGNLEATQAIRKESEHRGIPPDRVICTGDLTAYCASPVETVELIREWGIHLVMGNCEESLANNSSDCGCGFEQDSVCALRSTEWFEYTNSRITQVQRNWMKEIPRSLRFTLGAHSFLVVHGAPSSINRFVFPCTSPEVKQSELRLTDTNAVIGGHCGIPFGEQIGQQFWINTGVVGLPANDGTPDGWYLLLELIGQRICATWHRLVYDYHKARLAMQNAGLNSGYSDALSSGLWPSLDTLPQYEKNRQGIPIEPTALWI